MKKQNDFEKYVQTKIDKKNKLKELIGLDNQEVMLFAVDILMGAIFDDSQKRGKKVNESYGGTIGGKMGESECDSEIFFNFSIGERAKIINEVTSNPKYNDIVNTFKNELDKKMN